ncbi:MAG: hypothetical protein Kow00107_11290 [Planctomycetota bacterium]
MVVHRARMDTVVPKGRTVTARAKVTNAKQWLFHQNMLETASGK